MLSTFHCKLSSAPVVKSSAKMAEGEFWNNLDSFVEKKHSAGSSKGGGGSEKVGDWLNSIPDPSKSDGKSKKKKKKPASSQATPQKPK